MTRLLLGFLLMLTIPTSLFSLSYYTAEAQIIPVQFKPIASEKQAGNNGQTLSTSETELADDTDFAIRVQFEPHENEFLAEEEYYEVLDFTLAVGNLSKLCTTCEFDLDEGKMTGEFLPGERSLSGKLRVDTGDETKILDLNARWQTVEEHEEDGDTVQVIEGTVGAGREQFNPYYESRISGTLEPDGDGLVLEVQGTE